MVVIKIKGLKKDKPFTNGEGEYKGNYLVGMFKGQVRLIDEGIEITTSNMNLAKDLQRVLKKYL